MSDTAGARRPWTIAPYFLVDDVVATAGFYRDKLGFDYERFWGVTPARDLCDQRYGMRDFEVDDCNGYRLCFGRDLEG